MRVPYSWLNEFVGLVEDADEIAAAFNQLGIEVEGLERPAADIEGVVAARVLSLEPHPNADRLRLVMVDDGSAEPTQVVCGAPEIRIGSIVPWARPGSRLPGGFELSERKIRGIVSPGMLCSEAELELPASGRNGLCELPDNLEPGADVAVFLGKGDVVFDLSITPNRPDAMCVIGLARELAAHFGRELCTPPPVVEQKGDLPAPSVVVDAPEACPRYLGWTAEVEIGPSPVEIARRLLLCGMRPINNVVDVTNYVLLERNQPLHAFDADRVSGVRVRMAQDGEVIRTLDGKDRTLTSTDLLICDTASVPQAVAGVMGGEHSEVTSATTRILLEAAYFAPHGISITSRRLGLRTEASSRFDRGIDPNGVRSAAVRAMQLLEQTANARVSRELTDVGAGEVERATVALRPRRVNAILGTDLPAEAVRALLAPLGFQVEGSVVDGEAFHVLVPTWRPDVEREIDLIEEVGRRVGYQNIPPRQAIHSFRAGGLTRFQQESRLLADVMVGAGYLEAKCFPLVAPEEVEAFGLPRAQHTNVSNPLRKEESVLAPSLLPGLLKSVAHNVKQGMRDVALFEVDRTFHDSGQQLMDEHVDLAAVLTGSIDERPHGSAREVTVFDLTRALTDIVAALRLADAKLQRTEVPGFAPGAHEIVVDGRRVGAVGQIAPATAKVFEVQQPVMAFELHVQALLAGARSDESVAAVSSQPPGYFDLAFVVDAGTPSQVVVEAVRRGGGDAVESVRTFDVYAGEQLPEGKKSVAVAVTARSQDRTLTDEDLAVIRAASIEEVANECGGVLR